MKSIQRVDILGCPFDAVSFSETIEEIRTSVRTKSCLRIVPGSIDSVMKAKRNKSFSQLLWLSDLVVADGVPIIWSASALGTPIRGRVSGTEMVWHCAEISADTGCSVALVGAAPGIAANAAVKMMERYPGSVIQAIDTPFPLGPVESSQVAAAIRKLGASIVLVALGAPKQEKWVRDYLEDCGASVGIGVGSAFDIISGDKPRAPDWMQSLGMEWFHRLMLEPGRLGRRYLVEDSPFVLHLAGAILKKKLGIGEKTV